MTASIKYVALIRHVREVSMEGTADLAYWQERLDREGLHCFQSNGRARLLLSASDLRFRGIRFRELSICVLVSRAGEGTTADGAFLVHAFNSSRFFAFCERVLFSTPYHHARIAVNARLPPSFEVLQGKRRLLCAAMGADTAASPRTPTRTAIEGFRGPVFLAIRTGNDRSRRRFFYALIDGLTQAYPFDPSRDQLSVDADCGVAAARALRESDFVPTEWQVRDDATHGKSKTYVRGDEWPECG